mgnify:CR=1 FL=1
MGISCRSSNDTSSQSFLLKLKAEQERTKEGTKNWFYYQDLMNQIIAQNYLHYVNR